MKNIVKMFIFMFLIITNVNLVSAMEKAGDEAVVMSDAARDAHINEMYQFARNYTDLAVRRARTIALFGEFTRAYRAPRSKSAETGTDAGTGAEECKA